MREMRQGLDVSFDWMGTSLKRLVCVKELDYGGTLYNALRAIEDESRKPGGGTYDFGPDEPEGDFVGWFSVRNSDDREYRIYVEQKRTDTDDDMESDSDSNSNFECSLEVKDMQINVSE